MWKDFFFFSQGERSGILILISLITMMFAINFCLPSQESYADSFLAQADSIVTYTQDSVLISRTPTHHYSQKDSSYRKQIKSNASKETHQQRRMDSNSRSQAISKNNYAQLTIELNSADTTTLKKLRGIGSKLSQRIVKYRDKIGGFSNKEDLRKIYGLSEETYLQIVPHVWVDTTLRKTKRANSE